MPAETSHQDEPARERVLIEAARKEAGEWQNSTLGTQPLHFRPGKEELPGYDVIRELHRGGQGVVYEALQRSTHRRVAIKVMLAGAFAGEASLLRFEREVRLLAGLRHPNIVVIHDSGTAQGCRYFIMDLISGVHLDRYCRSKALGVVDTVRLYRRVVDAVAFAHDNGVIHRDLKPSNIIVADDGNPYVLDFGLAKVTAGSHGESLAASISVTGDVLGTVRYMSPEQVSGNSDCVDAPTDVHALGVILYELLAGSHPYECGASLSAMIDNIKRTDPPRISVLRPEIDRTLEGIILKCMCKEPARRYPSALEMKQDMDAWLGCQSSGPDSLGQLRKATHGPNHRRIIVLSVAFFSLLAACLVIVGSWRHFHRGDTNHGKSQSATFEASSGLDQASVPPLTTTQSAANASGGQVAVLAHVRQNLPLQGLHIQPVPGEHIVRIEGWLLNEAEMRVLNSRLASVRDQVQLEVQVNPEEIRLLVQQALVKVGGQDVKVRLEGRKGAQQLNIELSDTGSAAQMEAVAREFVFDHSAIHFRVY